MNSRSVMLVTGSRKGIGKAISEYYCEKGNVVIGCSRQSSDFRHENYFHHQLDVSDETAAKELFRHIKRTYERLDVLVNNAGVGSMNHSLLTPLKTARKILDTNVIGTFLYSREAAKLMMKTGGGRIVNFSSFAVPFKLEGEAIYAASKAAIVTLTEILAREYADSGITVNAVAPATVKTDLINKVAKEKLERLLRRQSIRRYGTPEEVCAVIDFFMQPGNGSVNGQTIYLGGV